MTRRKTSKKHLVKLISAFFAFVAVVMIFLPAVKYVIFSKTTNEFTGIMISFGYTQIAGSGIFTTETRFLEFSILNLLPYVLTIVAMFLIVAVSSRKKIAVNYIIVILLVASAVLFFLAPSFVVSASTDLANIPMFDSEFFKLGVGAILSGVFSALSALTFLFNILSK